MSDERNLQRRMEIVAEGFFHSALPLILVQPDGRILAASRGVCELVKLPWGRLVGNPVGALFVPALDVTDCRDHGVCNPEYMQLEIQTSEGALLPVEVVCRKFFAPDLGREGAGIPGTGDPADREPNHCLLYISDTRQRDHDDELRAARLAKLSLLNQVSEALYGANLTLDQVLEAVLICITAGQGLRFNRAFLLLVDEKSGLLKGELAIGPSNADEAARIWHDLAYQGGDLFSMMTSYDQSIKQTDVAVNEIVRHMVIPLDQESNVLVRSMQERQARRITPGMILPGVATIQSWLGYGEFAVAPLITRSGMLGAIIADNAISGNTITDLDLEFLQLFANQSASAIENSRLYTELEKRLIALRKAHEKQKEDQETLLRMERLSVMGETSAIVAHELRNPLVAIGGFARALVRNLDDDDPNHQYAAIITEEVGRMETIIHDLLDFIRPQKLLRKDVAIDQLAADTAARFREELEKKHIELELDCQAPGVLVSCNPGEIQQVLQNFLMNAIQVMADGGRLEVRTRLLDGGVKVEVCDTGPGFAKEVADKLFSPFFTTKPTGSGLGLTICSQIIKSHGGVAGARNRSRKGAGFSFILPLPKE
ncbi:MAG: ATP-binding protein [bacterium]|nr:hypothetical protein [bacterium]